MKEILHKIKLRLPVMLLLAATLFFWGFYDRYEPAGPVLLASPGIADAARVRGAVSETNGIFRLDVPMGGKTAELRFPLADANRYSIIRLSGSISTDQVVQGRYAWNCARLLLIQRDDKGKWVPADHGLLSEQGTVPWTGQVQEFEMVPKAATAEVVVQMSGTSGTAFFQKIEAVPVKIKSSFPVMRIVFCLLWIGIGLLYFKRCRLDRRKFRILILLNAIAILYGTLIPGKWIQDASELMKKKVEQTISKPAAVPKNGAPKADAPKKKPDARAHEEKHMQQFSDLVASAHALGHFILFSSLCFLVYCSAWAEKQHPVYYVKVMVDILIFAAVSESLQHLTLDRTPGVGDWLIDLKGMLLALVLFLLVRGLSTFFPRVGKA